MMRLALGLAVLALAHPAHAQDKPRSPFDALIASHAKANGVPESLVHRVIVQESRYNARAVGRGGTMGLMQIKHATARGVGYTGTAAGLLDPDTNLTYAVRYLAGALRAAGGNADRAIAYFRSGYYQSRHKMAAERKAARQDADASTARSGD
jgi:soluble lytic murein transglycosylase-like protein